MLQKSTHNFNSKAHYCIFLVLAILCIGSISAWSNTTFNNSLNASSSVAEHTLPTIWLVVYGGLLLGLFATSFFIRTHPVFVPIFGFLLIVAIMVAIPLSNAYEELADNAILSGAATQQGVVGFLMLNLPLTTLIIGLLTLIITFAKPGDDMTTLA